ncbi:MAG: hypothetical protein HRU11_03790 [Parvularculaceae bacterium]|nr:hypothetical protein [Parvularculaceae bacterium]
MLRSIFIILAFLPGLAFAADPLTRAEVENFVKASEKLEELSGKYPELEEEFDNYDMDDAMKMMDQMFASDGSFQMFSVVMKKVSDHPKAKGDVMRIVKSNGFKSTDHFAKVGDRIMAAEMASEMSKDDLEQMRMLAQMPESQLNMIPGPMRAMAQIAPKIAAVVESVPASDKKLVKELKPFDSFQN